MDNSYDVSMSGGMDLSVTYRLCPQVPADCLTGDMQSDRTGRTVHCCHWAGTPDGG